MTPSRSGRWAVACLFLVIAAVTGAAQVTVPEQHRHLGDEFLGELGTNTDIDGDRLVAVGARGLVVVQTFDGLFWEDEQRFDLSLRGQEAFGTGLALDGDVFAVGSPFADVGPAERAGIVRVFTRIDGEWQQTQELRGSVAEGRLGWSIAIQGDTMAVGVPRSTHAGEQIGELFVYTRQGNDWALSQELRDPGGDDSHDLGMSVSLDGDTLVGGAPRGDWGGRISIFRLQEGSWQFQASRGLTSPDYNDQFGHDVAVSGRFIAIGNNRYSDAFVTIYEGGASGSWSRTATLVPDRPDGSFRYFGRRLDFDGDTLVVGSMNRDPDESGLVDLFRLEGTRWHHRRSLAPSTPQLDDYFATTGLAISGERVVVGAPAQDEGAPNGGAVFTFADLSLVSADTDLRAGDTLRATVHGGEPGSLVAVFLHASSGVVRKALGTFDPAGRYAYVAVVPAVIRDHDFVLQAAGSSQLGGLRVSNGLKVSIQ